MVSYMRHKYFLNLFFVLIIFSLSVSAYAHPGRLDSNGGHYDRSTGEYHYHDGASSGSGSGSNSDSEDYTYSVFLGPTDNYSSGSSSGSSSSSSGTGNSSYSSDSTTTEATTVADTEEAQEESIIISLIENLFVLIYFLPPTLILFFVIKKLYVKYKGKRLAKKLKNQIKDIENRKLQLDKRSAYKLKKNISGLRGREDKLDRLYEKILSTNPKEYYEYFLSKNTLASLSGFPNGIYDFSGLLVDTESDEPYGRFTVYSAPESNKIHIVKGCNGALTTHHILYSDLSEFSFCSKCHPLEQEEYFKNKKQFIEDITIPYKVYKNNQHIISTYNVNLPKFYTSDKFSVNNIRFEHLAGFPDDIYINEGIVNDTKSNERYGRLTVYLVSGSKAVHLTEGCCGAHTITSMIFLSETIEEHRLCEQCGYSEKRFLYFNAEKWYRRYKKIKAYYTENLKIDITETEDITLNSELEQPQADDITEKSEENASNSIHSEEYYNILKDIRKKRLTGVSPDRPVYSFESNKLIYDTKRTIKKKENIFKKYNDLPTLLQFFVTILITVVLNLLILLLGSFFL